MSAVDEQKMERMIRPGGSLYVDGYVDWHPDHGDSVFLNGPFTPNELRWLANYIERGARKPFTMDVWVLTNKLNGLFYCKDGQLSSSPDHAYVTTEAEAEMLEVEHTNLTKRKVQVVLSSN
jgi:hypothetical protein